MRWDSYAAWLESTRDRFDELAQKRLSQSHLHVAVTEQDRAFSDEATPDFNIQLMMEGELHLEQLDIGFGKSSGPTLPGEFVVVPAHAPLEIDGKGAFKLAMVSIPWQHIAHDVERLAGRPISHFERLHEGIQRDEFVTSMMMNLVTADFESELAADSTLSMLVARLLHLSDSPSARLENNGTLAPQVRSRLLEYIHAHVSDVVGLESLAEIAQCSRFHLCRSFRASTGMSPNEYLIRLRVETAKEKIRRGESLTDAALDAGFSDQSHMTRQFKRIYGVTPGRYRKELS